jgi:hypothetical protein
MNLRFGVYVDPVKNLIPDRKLYVNSRIADSLSSVYYFV